MINYGVTSDVQYIIYSVAAQAMNIKRCMQFDCHSVSNAQTSNYAGH